MNPQLSYIHSQERIAELHRAGRRARLATEASIEWRRSRQCNPITRLGARLARLTTRVAPSSP
jgi:hypothetical protein